MHQKRSKLVHQREKKRVVHQKRSKLVHQREKMFVVHQKRSKLVHQREKIATKKVTTNCLKFIVTFSVSILLYFSF